MASAAELLLQLKQGQVLRRPGHRSMHATLYLEGALAVYREYCGESKWSHPKRFTLAEVATWTDERHWEVEDAS